MTQIVSCDTAIPIEKLRAIKARQQAMWASGDFAVIGSTLQIVGELLVEAADVRGLHRVLDVAAGNGNATLAAARRFASVTSTDYVPALLERGQLRADAEGFANITFEVADAEATAETYSISFAAPSASNDLWVRGVRYLDDLVREDGDWKIRRRLLTLDWAAAMPTTFVNPFSDRV